MVPGCEDALYYEGRWCDGKEIVHHFESFLTVELMKHTIPNTSIKNLSLYIDSDTLSDQ